MEMQQVAQKCRAKMDDWLASISDEAVKTAIAESAIITGGAIASLIQDQPVNDYDVYFRDMKSVKKVAEYYVGNGWESTFAMMTPVSSFEELKFSDSSASIQTYNPEKDYDVHLISRNAITLQGDIQVITAYVGHVDNLHERFDFLHCQGWYDYRTDTLHVADNVLEAITNKVLTYNTTNPYPLRACFRMYKFLSRGYTISMAEHFKILLCLQEHDLTDFRELGLQLQGLYNTYYSSLIAYIVDMPRTENTISLILKWLEEHPGASFTSKEI